MPAGAACKDNPAWGNLHRGTRRRRVKVLLLAGPRLAKWSDAEDYEGTKLQHSLWRQARMHPAAMRGGWQRAVPGHHNQQPAPSSRLRQGLLGGLMGSDRRRKG
ncbi:hypothetical protein M409DRAFT_60817 [Zasmidium cellare ATCC 36951]|uniref:Uncharacterized protein n=1 Tax=Zasmidium cellare ATCC 36951 TaxID=1080233 RepID=A0A6A6BXD8_ZASCE|nr:uncharacterized protein M409DRAFT_60817 [Zasmidium cellare ATCC 36951]KAF2159471.1 hypothetical protein M409DRAFT_60817 [Zasmidium cellare ATCC 36951]